MWLVDSYWYLATFVTMLIIHTATPMYLSENITRYYDTQCTTEAHIDDNVSNDIVKVLGNSKSDSAWMPITKISLNGWYWMDRTLYGELPCVGEECHECGVLFPVEPRIVSSDCKNTYNHYMCHANSSACSMLSGHQKCVEAGGIAYAIFQSKTKYNWYDALWACESKGYQLAAIKSTNIKKAIKSLFQPSEYSNVWIGLRKMEYRWRDGETVHQFHWGPHPTCLDCKCVIIQRHNRSKYYWKQENCNHSYHHLCEGLPPTEVPGGTGKHGNSTKNTRNIGLILGLILLSLVLFGSLCILVVYCFLKRKTEKKKSQPILEVTEEKLLPSKEPGESETNQEQQELKSLSKNEKETTKNVINEEPNIDIDRQRGRGRPRPEDSSDTLEPGLTTLLLEPSDPSIASTSSSEAKPEIEKLTLESEQWEQLKNGCQEYFEQRQEKKAEFFEFISYLFPSRNKDWIKRNCTFENIPNHLEKWRKDRPKAMKQGEAVVQMQEILKERGIDL